MYAFRLLVEKMKTAEYAISSIRSNKVTRKLIKTNEKLSQRAIRT